MLKAILIVDDRVINLEFLATLLGYAGYRVLKALNGAQALDMLDLEQPALVISDVLMPVMDGLELLEQLHGDPARAHIPVIFYTATDRFKTARTRAHPCAPVTLLTKPAEPQDILDAVAKALGVLVAAPQRLQLALAAADVASDVVPDLAPELAAIGNVPTLSLRLAALLEVSITLAAERDSKSLLALFCRDARNIMRATEVAVGVYGNGQSRRSSSGGMTAPEVDAIFSALDADGGALRQRIASAATLAAADVEADPQLQGLPPEHPLRRRFLLVALMRGAQPQGWLYVAGKVGGADFDLEDREFAGTLAAQVAPLYENLNLYEEVRQHAQQLELEVQERKLVEDRLRQSEAGLRRAQILTKAAHILSGHGGTFESWSKTLPQLIGVSDAGMPSDTRTWLDIVDPADRAKFIACSDAAVSSGLRREVGYRLERGDGATIELHQVMEPLPEQIDADGNMRWFHTIQDVTQQKEQERKVVRLSRVSAVLSGINSAIVRIHDRQALFQEACRIAVSLGAFGLAWIALVDAETGDGEVAACFGAADGAAQQMRFATRPGNEGSTLPWSVAVHQRQPAVCNDIRTDASLLGMRDELLQRGYQSVGAFPLMLEGRAVAVITLFADEAGVFDEDELRLLNELAGDLSFGLQFIAKEERLRYLACYDVLTGLPNSMLFHDRLTQFLQSSKHDTGMTGVIMLDLDHFSHFNDVMGRHAGDAILTQVAQRLGASLVEPYSLARIGGDIFAIAVSDLTRAADAISILEQQIFGALDASFVIERQEVRITARAGLALYPDDGRDAETLFKHAEVALKKTKSSDERYLFYAPRMNAAIAARLSLKGELETALARRQFEVYYQPRVDLHSGCIVSAEALIRWQHPQRGRVPPDQFIPLAEETGLIVPIGAWVIDAVCAQQAAWLAEGVRIVPVAVNLSAVQFEKGVVLQTIQEALSRHGLETEHIEFELTESVVMNDPEQAARKLQAMKEMGVKLSLDDFGTGFSSLAYLKRFPFDFVKIDRAFITDITKSAKDAMIATAVIAMGHSLNLRVVAEGVETEGQLAYLCQHRCDEMQGYFFSPPVPAAAFVGMLIEDKRLLLPPREG